MKGAANAKKSAKPVVSRRSSSGGKSAEEVASKKKLPGGGRGFTPSSVGTEPFLIPNHSFDVHIKRQAFIVEAQLHRIPEKLIDVEVEKDRVTISTLRFTKKFKLDVAIPSDVEADVHAASSTLDHSTLRVIVPLKKIPASYIERVEAIRSAQKNARQLRFGETQDGNLKMRVKKIIIAPSEVSRNKKPTKRNRLECDVDDEDPAEEREEPAAPAKKQKGSGAAKAYASEKASMLRLMHDVAMETQQKALEKQERFEKLQRLRTERLMTRRECIKEREEKKQSAYHKILSEKKTHLQRMAEQANPSMEPLVVHRVNKGNGTSSDVSKNNSRRKGSPGKRVSWAPDSKP